MDDTDPGLTRPITVFLLDDHEIVRRGLIDLLGTTADIIVVGEAGTAAEALARIPAVRPDVALLDARLPDGSGIDVCRDIRSSQPEVHCLILTSYDDDEALFAAVMAGAAGYLLKQIGGRSLTEAIRQVAAGGSLMDPAVTGKLLDRLAAPTGSGPTGRLAHRSGAGDPRPDRRRTVQPADRRAAVPGREDGEELRVDVAGQAPHAAPHPGRGLRRRGAYNRFGPAGRLTDASTDAIPSSPSMT